MANLDKNAAQKWLVQSLDTQKGGFETELATAGKYLDRNIVVDVKVKDGALAFDKDNGQVKVTEGYVDQNDEITLDVASHANSVSIGSAKYLVSTETNYPVTADAQATVSQGYVKSETKTDATQAKKYIKAGSIQNVATEGVEYTENDSTGAVVSNGFLYINEGYQEAQKISLGTLIPDDINIGETGHGVDLVYKGITAYDENGNKLTGTMQDAAVAVSAVVDADTVKEAADSDVVVDGEGFKVEVSKAITGTITSNVTQIGYVTSIGDSTNVTGSADTTVKLAKATMSATNGEVVAAKPALSSASVGIAGVTDAAKTGATTTAPESGVFVKVDASAAAGTKGSVALEANVTGAGYAKVGTKVATGSVETTLADADSLYIPIKEGSVTIPAVSVTTTETITGNQTDGYKITVTGSGTTAPQVTAGWVASVAESNVTVTGSADMLATQLTQDGVSGTDYVVSASAGYNAAKLETKIPVYQGEVVGA